MNRLLCLLLVACAPSHDDQPATPDTLDAAQLRDAAPPDAGSEEAPAVITNVYLIAGQSNAVGAAQPADLSPENDAFVDPYPAVQIAQQINCPTNFTLGPAEVSTDWGDLAPRLPGQRFGIELSAGRVLDDRLDNVFIIKTATNGTNLYSNWDPETAFSQFAYLESFVDERLAELGGDARVAGLFWIQGNGDASSNERAQDYAANLGWLIMRLRQKYGAQMNVVIDRMPDSTLPFAATVRAQQLIVAQRVFGVVHVDTSDLALNGTQHYTADSLITLGARMAAAMPAPSNASYFYWLFEYDQLRRP